jgi:hypothetical protein
MRSLIVALVVAASGPSFSSCDPTHLKQPLAGGSGAPDKTLLGAWAGHVGDTETTLHLVSTKDGAIDVVVVAQKKDDSASALLYQAVPAVVGGKTYFNLREKHITDMLNGKFDLSSDYQLARFTLSKGGTLQVDYLADEGVTAAVTAGAIHADQGAQLVITDDAPAVAAFLAKPEGDHAFKPFGTFHRLKIDYGKPPAK